MNVSPLAKQGLLLGAATLALAVLIGAFGAHGLKSLVTPEKLVTFETGVRYQFYHGFALLFCGLIHQLFPSVKVAATIQSFLAGILIFSFNCYVYVLTDAKYLAMMIPVGGVLFVLGWIHLTWNIFKLQNGPT